MIDFEEEVAAPTNAQLDTISKLALKQRLLEAQVKLSAEHMDQLNAALRRVSEVDLPEAMLAVGMESFSLSDGTKITIKKDTYASITEAHKTAAFEWLEQNGLADVIKHEVGLSFGRGEGEKVKEVVKLLADAGVKSIKAKSGVHPQTLKALVKEQIESGKDIPSDVFGIYHLSKSKVEV